MVSSAHYGILAEEVLGTKSVGCGNSVHKPCHWRWPTRRERVLRAGGICRVHEEPWQKPRLEGGYPVLFDIACQYIFVQGGGEKG